jgi:outer membrane receptor protein involved in Fe transport
MKRASAFGDRRLHRNGRRFFASNLDNSRTYQFVDNVSFVKGKHSFKVGGDVRRLLDDATTNNTPFGDLSFTGDLSGDAAADYLLGIPRTVLTPEGVPITAARQWRFAVYGQDDWKVTPKLTVNLGLRYDLFNPPHDANHGIYTLDFITNPAVPTFIPVTDPIWASTTAIQSSPGFRVLGHAEYGGSRRFASSTSAANSTTSTYCSSTLLLREA